MATVDLTRRDLLKGGGSVAAGLTLLHVSGPARAFQATPAGGAVIPWVDQPAENPVPEAIVVQLEWEALEEWTTPNDEFFVIKHYNLPELAEQDWHLDIGGLVTTPMTLALADLKARDRSDVTFTMECSGNTGLPFFIGGVGNATWGGTSLAALLEEAGIAEGGTEVVFWGADAGEQTYGEVTITEQFARSMSVSDAMSPENLLVYEMNGEELPPLHGYPLRLIAPGWYGVANVKWLTRIEVVDRRFQGHFMSREYVTMREVMVGDEMVWTFNSVSHDRLKSAPAKVTMADGGYSVMGAAWGAPIASVDVRVDDGEWQPATITMGEGEEYAWAFWTFDLGTLEAGEHTITSRATAANGDVQPEADDPFLAGKSTYWESNGQITRTVLIE